jgi:hypothetical protein
MQVLAVADEECREFAIGKVIFDLHGKGVGSSTKPAVRS